MDGYNYYIATDLQHRNAGGAARFYARGAEHLAMGASSALFAGMVTPVAQGSLYAALGTGAAVRRKLMSATAGAAVGGGYGLISDDVGVMGGALGGGIAAFGAHTLGGVGRRAVTAPYHSVASRYRGLSHVNRGIPGSWRKLRSWAEDPNNLLT